MWSSVVDALDAYCAEVRQVRAVPDADPEPALYPALSGLLRRFVALAGHQRASVVGQARTEVGKPDFVLDDGGPIGYVEAKRPDQSLSKLRGHDRKQKERFLDLPNLLLTNYRTFELYVGGERVDRIEIRPATALEPDSPNGHVTSESAEQVFRLVERFSAHTFSSPKTPRELADRLARAARILRDAVHEALEGGRQGAIADLLNDWRESLFADQDAAGFADAYAQTLAYGLLTARMQTSRPLSIEQAEDTLQATHPFLAAALRFLSDPQVEQEIGWAANLLVRVLDPATPEVFRPAQSAPDPLLYFYEDFLARYDPALRERRGVYYTPPPVVQFQVRALQDLLVERLGKRLGFADKGVEVLDPAAGTGTYLLAAIDVGAELCRGRYGQVSRGHVQRMLAQVRGFELLVGPYTVAHQRLAVRSAELAGELLPPEEVAVFLTDTLAPSHAEETRARMPLALKPLAREREGADRIKDRVPIIAILGNPPYDRSKAASGQWIEESLMRDFKDPVPPEDRVHLKSLADPYVYFFRWSLWKLFEQERNAGPRLLSFISNSSYLGGEAFQGMRKVLRDRFDEIWVLDLGGEQRGANPSENVFDIRVGVCIVVCFSAGAPKAAPATVRYARFGGTRAEKYERLTSGSLESVEWEEVDRPALEPLLPVVEEVFSELPRLDEVMPVVHSGVQTKADALLVAPRRQELVAQVSAFLTSSVEERARGFRDPGRRATQMTSRELDEGLIRRVAYRPLDYEYLYSDANLVARPRPSLVAGWHPGQRYFSTLTRGHGEGPALFLHGGLPDLHAFRGSFGGHVFPFDTGSSVVDSPNLAPEVLPTLRRRLERDVQSDDVLAYIYAVLFAPAYQRRFAEALAQSLPRVPFSADPELFSEGVTHGRRLIDLHTLSAPVGRSLFVRGSLGPVVRPSREDGELRICEDAAIPVTEDAWRFGVSGYRIIERWLRRREGLNLGEDPDLLEELFQVVGTVEETTRMVPLLDDLLERVLAGALVDWDDFVREPWRRDAERLQTDARERERMSEDARASEALSFEALESVAPE